jgi:ABC-2 type transport system ATP-binding protein
MKQRVKLAQAIAHDPRFMLLDEPTNGLDPEGRDQMLDLIRRTGTEFGISILMSSHLLGEIERVCDYLVVIDAGRLMRAAPVASYLERTGVLAVELESGAELLAARLQAAGLRAHEEGRLVLVAAEDDTPYDLIRDTAADLGVGLIRLEQRRQSIEELFRAPAGEPEGHHVAG